jgi:hypothetical protein
MSLDHDEIEDEKRRRPLIYNLLMLAGVLFLLMVVWGCYLMWRTRRVRKNMAIQRLGSLRDIQSGDLYFSLFCGTSCGISSAVVTHLTGTAWTHVGVFHRDMRTGQLYVLEFADDGVRYSTIENRVQFYAGYIGVRHLRNPLCTSQLEQFQHIIDDTMRGHNQAGDNVHIGSYAFGTCRVVNLHESQRLVEYGRSGSMETNFNQTCVLGKNAGHSMLCTDFVLAVLLRLRVVQRDASYLCLHPKFFWKDKTINQVYADTLLLKDYEAEHDKMLNHCRFEGTRQIIVNA